MFNVNSLYFYENVIIINLTNYHN